jgi:formiminotetrahydrofolate cyclodeaminase
MSGIGDMPLRALLEALAARTPAPGGGAAAGVVGGVGVALAGMVVAYSLGRADLAAHAGALDGAAGRLEAWRADLLRLADQDAEAYAHLNRVRRLPPEDPRRAEGLADAAWRCVEVPLRVLEVCTEAAELCAALVPITNRHLRSDLRIAALVCEAAAQSSACTVEINLGAVGDERAAEARRRTADLLARAVAALARVEQGAR